MGLLSRRGAAERLRNAARAALALPGAGLTSRLLAQAIADDVPGLSAEMAYRFLLALFPFFVFLGAATGFIGAAVGSENLFAVVMNFVSPLGPEEVQSVVRDWVHGVVYTQSLGLLTLGAVAALWSATSGTGILVKSLNRAHRVARDRPFWRAQLVSIVATLALAGTMLTGVALYSIGEIMGKQVAARGLGQELLATWQFLGGPGVALGLFVVLVAVYAWLPNVAISLRQAVPGAAFATAAWVAITRGFSVYLAHLDSLEATYGGMATAILVLVWLYAVGAMLVMGGEINALLAGHRANPRIRGIEGR